MLGPIFGGLVVGEDDVAGEVLGEIVLHLGDEVFLEGDVLVGRRIDEVVARVVLVAELVFLAAHGHEFERFVGVEALHERLAGAHGA